MIYIVGDSHVSVFSGVDLSKNGLRHMQPEFGTCYTLSQGQLRNVISKFEQNIPHFLAIKVGSHTAYNSINKVQKIEQVIKEYKINKNDYLFLSFGQIDIQNHLVKNSIKNNVSLSDTIDNCIERYGKTIKYLKSNYPDLRLGIYTPPATSIGCGNNPIISTKESIKINNITFEFNEKLKILANKLNILYKDISTNLVLDNGLTDNKFVLDDIHLSQEAMPLIMKEFKDLIK
tara:strand:+ start:13495 stop:14190 length:696 start_codon:yes stop_codon:yes gene_type:complete